MVSGNENVEEINNFQHDLENSSFCFSYQLPEISYNIYGNRMDPNIWGTSLKSGIFTWKERFLDQWISDLGEHDGNDKLLTQLFMQLLIHLNKSSDESTFVLHLIIF